MLWDRWSWRPRMPGGLARCRGGGAASTRPGGAGAGSAAGADPGDLAADLVDTDGIAGRGRFGGRDDARLHPAGMRAALRALGPADLRHVLGTISVPTR